MKTENLSHLLSQEHFEDIKFYKQPANWIESGFIVTATSARHINAFINKVKKMSLIKRNEIEGIASSEWVILNFHETIVHIFTQEKRNYYQLDELWEEGVVNA